jgi:hypothetical protein
MHAYSHSRLVGAVGRSLLHNVDVWQYRHNCCNIGHTRDRLGQMQGKASAISYVHLLAVWASITVADRQKVRDW